MKKVNFLIVTDLAARGIDIPLLDNVINFDFPPKMKLFIHRAGRTARNGQKGTAYTIITKQELPYLHDLSIFIGRRYYDSRTAMRSIANGEFDDNTNGKTEEITLKEKLENPLLICYGRLPQNSIDEYTQEVEKIMEYHDGVLVPLAKSMELSLNKYNKTRDPASVNAVRIVREMDGAEIHPLLCNSVDQTEIDLMKFKESLKLYKPKQSVLE